MLAVSPERGLELVSPTPGEVISIDRVSMKAHSVRKSMRIATQQGTRNDTCVSIVRSHDKATRLSVTRLTFHTHP